MQRHVNCVYSTGANVEVSTLVTKMEEVLQLLKAAKQVQHYTFSQAKTGKDTAVAAALAVLGISGFAAGGLPDQWPHGWDQKSYMPFTLWPVGAQVYEATHKSQLCHHFHDSLTAFGVPLNIRDGFELMDVHHQTSKLEFACTTAASTIMFTGGTDAVVIPCGALMWELQTRVLFVWKMPHELRSVDCILVQAQLILMGSLFTSNHPALVVVTDGITFVLLQPWGRGVKYWHTFSDKPGYVIADNAMRLIAHHLLNISSRDPLFHHLEAGATNFELSKELVLLLLAKRELGEGEGLAQQLELVKDLPVQERFEASSAIILAWRQSNLSQFS